MEFRTQYKVDEALQSETARQLFFSVMLKKKWIGIAGFWIASGLSVVLIPEMGGAPTGVLFAVSLILTSMWVKTYFMVQKSSIDYLRTIEDNLTTLTINKDEMNISNSNGSKRIAWEKVDKIVETKSFFVPMIGKVPLICLPKDKLSNEASDFLRKVS